MYIRISIILISLIFVISKIVFYKIATLFKYTYEYIKDTWIENEVCTTDLRYWNYFCWPRQRNFHIGVRALELIKFVHPARSKIWKFRRRWKRKRRRRSQSRTVEVKEEERSCERVLRTEKRVCVPRETRNGSPEISRRFILHDISLRTLDIWVRDFRLHRERGIRENFLSTNFMESLLYP